MVIRPNPRGSQGSRQVARVEGTHVGVGITRRTAATSRCVNLRIETVKDLFFDLIYFLPFLCFSMLLEHTKRFKMKIYCRWGHSLVG